MTARNDEQNDSAGPAAASEPTLRRRAEDKARAMGAEDGESPSPEGARQLLHELRVHQIELEMQSEELRRAQGELEASRARYFDLYDLAPVGYFTLSEQGLILEANLTAATLLGEARRTLAKQPLSRFILPEDQDLYYRRRKQLFATGERQECEMRMVRADGSPFWARVEATVAQDNESRAPRAACRVVMSDITERHRAEEEIRRLNAELEQRVEERTRQLGEAQEKRDRQERLAVLGQLAGGVGHELRNPLSVIANAVYFLKLVLPDAEAKTAEYLGIIDNETRNAEKIIADLLDFARPRSADREPVAAAELARRVLERYPAPAGVTVSVQAGADLPPAYADARRMTEVLGNLVVNACQAMPQGGRLTISAVQRDDQVAIAVADTGVGIAPENMARIFEPLFTTRARGIGLGLAVCKTLVEANGGRIDVQSEPGRGSAFTVYLPAVKNG